MRYIQKNAQVPTDFQTWLDNADNRIEISRLFTAYESKSVTSKEVFELLRSPEKDNLRLFLLKEQGYICAYCGSRIMNNTHVRLDHVIPKSLQIKRTFDYYNLIAACSGGEYIWHIINEGDTLESIADKYATDVQRIKNLNPSEIFAKGNAFEVRIGTESIKVQVKSAPHCDVKKEDQPHTIKPTDTDCQLKFKYSGNGKVKAAESHEDEANKAITILGLNDNEYLTEKRRLILYRIDKIVKIAMRLDPTKLKQALIKRKENLYLDTEMLNEMVFVEEYFLNSFIRV